MSINMFSTMVNNSLVASDSTPFRFGVNENGEYGYIVTDSEGADTVVPFKSGGELGETLFLSASIDSNGAALGVRFNIIKRDGTVVPFQSGNNNPIYGESIAASYLLNTTSGNNSIIFTATALKDGTFLIINMDGAVVEKEVSAQTNILSVTVNKTNKLVLYLIIEK